MLKNNNNQKISGIYAITPNQILAINTVEKALKQHQISILQYRRKTNSTLKLAQVKSLQKLCRSYNTLFIVNDDINLAEKIQADGVHLGKNDAKIEQARKQLGAEAIIGISCYNDINIAKIAQDSGANYAAFGALFSSKTKPAAANCPLKIITQAKQILTIPIVGIGGINFSNQAQAFAAGCDAVAMIDALWKSQ